MPSTPWVLSPDRCFAADPAQRTVARELYTKYGFREVGRRKNYYLEPLEDALVMQKAWRRLKPRA